MKNLLLKNSIDSLASDVDFALNNLHRRAYIIENFERLKPEIPFSDRLNSFLLDFYEERKHIFVFVDEDDFESFKNPKEALNHYVARYKSTEKIHVFSGACENTIFGDPYFNLIGRCFHEFYHVHFGLGYDFASESVVASLQANALPVGFVFEKELLLADLLGQAQYYSVNREFLKNQRVFVYQYLKDPLKAIYIKQAL